MGFLSWIPPDSRSARIGYSKIASSSNSRGKTSLGWFYGFKLHLLINTQGDLLGAELTPGNIDDRVPVEKLTQSVFGKLYADKGYISKELRQTLKTQDVDLIYKVRKNMKPQPLSTYDEVMLKKRMLIETVIGQLKSQTQLQHTRHRSFLNFQVNSVSALIAYTYLEKKPTLKLRVIDEIKDRLRRPKTHKIFYGTQVIGTLSTFTSVRNVSVGFNGYLGVHKNNVGLGVLGTYEIGLLGDIWLIKDDRFINIYPTFSYQFGKSTLIFSHGLSFFTTVFRLVDIEDLRRPVTAISYIYQPVGRLTFMFQGRLQDRDLWGEESSFTNRDVVLSIGVGF